MNNELIKLFKQILENNNRPNGLGGHDYHSNPEYQAHTIGWESAIEKIELEIEILENMLDTSR